MTNPIEKAHKLAEIKGYLAAGDSKRTAATRAGVSISTVTKWTEEENNALEKGIQGRKSAIEMTVEEANRLKFWRLTKDGSLPLAVREFLRDEACRPETRATLEAILNKYEDRRKRTEFPPSLRQIAHITDEDKALFRSKKRTQDFEMVISRGLFFADVDGTERPLLPNSCWESDDMSVNQPFRWTDPDSGREITGRQTLCTIDVFSHAWLGISPIGREKDAYRAEDIAEHMSNLITTKGLPYCWRLERGTWEGNFIHGIELEDGRRWGGVDELFHVIHTWKSRGKGTIEGAFRYLQARMSHKSLDIGRVCGEYDFAAREMRRAQNGQKDALSRLWTIQDAADALAEAMAEDNSVLKDRRAHLANTGGLLIRATDLYKPQVIRPIRREDMWRLLPVKKLATIRKGKVVIKDKYHVKPFEFVVNNGAWPGYLPDRTPVLIAFHPARPEEGCHVFCALRRGDVRNQTGLGFGDLITVALLLVEAPQFSLCGTLSDQQKTANATMRREYREIVPAGQHPALRTSTARDQLGRTLHEENGDRQAAPAEESLFAAPAPKPEATPAAVPRRRRVLDAEALREAAERELYNL